MSKINSEINLIKTNGSPDIKEGVINYLIDIDGTISEDIPNEEFWRMRNAKVLDGAIKFVNDLYQAGHNITFFTSRTDAHRADTEAWLMEHGFKYHGIIFNKPRGGNYLWIDDKSAKTVLFTGDYNI